MKKDYFLKRLVNNQLCSYQDYSYELVPEEFKATDKIPIICHSHGLFYQQVSSHTTGQGCQECGKIKRQNGRALTTLEFIDNSRMRFGDRFDYSKTVYVRKDRPLTITCRKHGDLLMTPDQHRWCTYGCRKCDFEIPREIARAKVIELAEKIHGKKYNYDRVNFLNWTKKVEIICPIHGAFWQSPLAHSKQGQRCNACAIDAGKCTIAQFISRSNDLYGQLYNYSNVKFTKLSDLVTIGCPTHGYFTQQARSHLAGNGCRKCHIESTRRTKEEFISKAKTVHGDLYDYSKVVYLGNKKKVEIICPIHGAFWQKPNTHTSSGNGCVFCSESKGERVIDLFLTSKRIPFVREHRVKPHLFRYDFFIPHLNIFIEYNGIQHYRPVEIFGGMTGFIGTKERDAIKKRIVEENCGHLIVIPYTYNSVEAIQNELISKLKKFIQHWYLIDDTVKTFDSVDKVYSFFKIPLSVQIKYLNDEICQKHPSVKVLF